MVSHGSAESCGPSLMRCPTASPFGQKREAIPRLITAAGAEFAPPVSENMRPAIKEIFNVSKKSELAICRSAEGISLILSAAWPSMVKKVVSLSTLLGGGLVTRVACGTPESNGGAGRGREHDIGLGRME